jgi:hypothetical protein
MIASVPNFIGMGLFIDDWSSTIVNDATESIENGQIGYFNLIHSPPIELPFIVQSK